MAKPIKTFEETLAEEMRDPEFREGFLQAKAEIEAFARKRDLCRANGPADDAAAGRDQASGRGPCAKRRDAN